MIRDLYLKATSSTPPPSTGDFLVRFLDIDGTVLKEERRNAGQDATAPTNPNYDPTYLVFNQWNQSFTNVQADIDVGAVYETIDPDKSYLFIRVTTNTGLQPSLFLNKTVAGTLTVDWGDSTTNTTTTTAGNVTITKTSAYSTVGDYLVTIHFTGVHTTQAYIMGNNTTYSRCLLKMYCGENIRGITSGGTFINNIALSIISLNQDFGGATNHTSSLFSGCWSLLHITLPNNGGTTLSNFAPNCYSLRSVSIPTTYTFYNGAFAQSNSLQSIVITGCDWFFSNPCFTNSGVTRLVFPSTLSTNNIATSTCSSCVALKEIIIQSGITTINNTAFSTNTSLKTVTIEGTTLTTLGSGVFSGCRAISVFEFPSSVTSIGTNCFNSCSSVLEYVFLSTTPPTLAGTNAFSQINNNCKIYVPDASVSAYQAATNWSVYASYIYPLSTRP